MPRCAERPSTVPVISHVLQRSLETARGRPILIDPADQSTAHPIMPPQPRRRDDRQPPGPAPPAGPPALTSETPEPNTPRGAQPCNLLRHEQDAPNGAGLQPYGRCAVGLRASLDPDAYFDAPTPQGRRSKTDWEPLLTDPVPSGMTCGNATYHRADLVKIIAH